MDRRQYLEISLWVPFRAASGIWWVEARVHILLNVVGQQRIIKPKMSTVLLLRNPIQARGKRTEGMKFTL